MFSIVNETFNSLYLKFKILLKWIFIPCLIGVIVGTVASLFSYTLTTVTNLRMTHSWFILLLPMGGIIIVKCYQLANITKPKGTNLVISSIRSSEYIPFVMAPLIFISTAITHLLGGSSGREGAALQLGGSIAQKCGRLLKFTNNDLHILTMCGMTAAFTALFGTPLTATIFSMEVISVGIMYYAAIVPCSFSAISALVTAQLFNIKPEAFTLLNIPDFELITILKIIVLSILCAFLSTLFCKTMHLVEHLFNHYFKNAYLKIIVGGIIIIILTFIFGHDYNGAGMDIIEQAINSKVVTYAFILKIIFTAITLGSGYKGGEIVPTFFIGATFGCLIGQLFNISPSLCAGIGMIATFCGVTNCPITSLILSFELFNFTGILYFLIAISISYMLSGYNGLYNAQKIMYSKYSPIYINKTTNH